MRSPQLAISLYGGLNRMAREESYAASRPEGHAMINHNAQHAGAVGMLVSEGRTAHICLAECQ